METISLHNTLPQVFSQRTDINSDIWKQDVIFEKNHLYLVEANSGTGKSSLCSYIFGYRHDYEGTILFDKNDVRDFSVSQWLKIRQTSLSLLWQELRLFPELSAMENIEIKNNLTRFQSMEQIRHWFDLLGISDKYDAKIGRMSFGQQQRVAMIRSLCQPFDFIFVDEPISHLDDTNSRIMGDILMEEAKKQGAGVIVTSIGKHMDLSYDKTFKL